MASKAFFFYTTGTNRCAKAEHNGAMTFFRTENNGKNMKKQVEDKVEPSELEPVKRLLHAFATKETLIHRLGHCGDATITPLGGKREWRRRRRFP